MSVLAILQQLIHNCFEIPISIIIKIRNHHLVVYEQFVIWTFFFSIFLFNTWVNWLFFSNQTKTFELKHNRLFPVLILHTVTVAFHLRHQPCLPRPHYLCHMCFYKRKPAEQTFWNRVFYLTMIRNITAILNHLGLALYDFFILSEINAMVFLNYDSTIFQSNFHLNLILILIYFQLTLVRLIINVCRQKRNASNSNPNTNVARQEANNSKYINNIYHNSHYG